MCTSPPQFINVDISIFVSVESYLCTLPKDLIKGQLQLLTTSKVHFSPWSTIVIVVSAVAEKEKSDKGKDIFMIQLWGNSFYGHSRQVSWLSISALFGDHHSQGTCTGLPIVVVISSVAWIPTLLPRQSWPRATHSVDPVALSGGTKTRLNLNSTWLLIYVYPHIFG